MYRNNSGRSFGRSRSSFGGKPSFRGGRARGMGRLFSGRRSGSRFGVSKIDISRYINKKTNSAPVETFVPKHTFNDFDLDQRVKANVAVKGYVSPTPIQDSAIPVIIQGKDIVGTANTGTGKTAAFLLPMIDKALRDKKHMSLIVVPTRELAQQIEEELKAFSKGLGMYSVCCVGGASIGYQLRGLRMHNNFVIGTPGRLKDLIERKALNLSLFKTVVLDEADRMLDMGFINDVRYMMSLMPKERQTLCFSATMSPEIERLINDFLNQPTRISVKTQDVSKNIEQDVIHVNDAGAKIDLLHDVLGKPECERVLIFGRTKHGVERLSQALVIRGFKSASIHGNKSQPQRQRALADFKSSRANILVATDVAARGLDIDNVTHVINYDLPATHEDYIHRIGRTGRGDKKGKALTFIER